MRRYKKSIAASSIVSLGLLFLCLSAAHAAYYVSPPGTDVSPANSDIYNPQTVSGTDLNTLQLAAQGDTCTTNNFKINGVAQISLSGGYGISGLNNFTGYPFFQVQDPIYLHFISGTAKAIATSTGFSNSNPPQIISYIGSRTNNGQTVNANNGYLFVSASRAQAWTDALSGNYNYIHDQIANNGKMVGATVGFGLPTANGSLSLYDFSEIVQDSGNIFIPSYPGAPVGTPHFVCSSNGSVSAGYSIEISNLPQVNSFKANASSYATNSTVTLTASTTIDSYLSAWHDLAVQVAPYNPATGQTTGTLEWLFNASYDGHQGSYSVATNSVGYENSTMYHAPGGGPIAYNNSANNYTDKISFTPSGSGLALGQTYEASLYLYDAFDRPSLSNSTPVIGQNATLFTVQPTPSALVSVDHYNRILGQAVNVTVNATNVPSGDKVVLYYHENSGSTAYGPLVSQTFTAGGAGSVNFTTTHTEQVPITDTFYAIVEDPTQFYPNDILATSSSNPSVVWNAPSISLQESPGTYIPVGTQAAFTATADNVPDGASISIIQQNGPTLTSQSVASNQFPQTSSLSTLAA